MNWTQVFKNAIITAICSPILLWVIIKVFGDFSEPATLHTYLLVGVASAIGGALGDILRQNSKR